MSFAASRVETKIVISGENNATEAVRSAREGIDGLAESSGDSERALIGIKDLLGDAFEGPLQRLADVAGGLEAVIKGLPGPLGVVAAGVAVVGVGAALLYKHVVETDAKVRELGDSATQSLADSLDSSVDAAIRLQQALGDLPLQLRPVDALLVSVRDRAEAMGLDGEAAAQKYVAALQGGPVALRAFEREFGRLAKATDDLPSVAERLGLSAEAVGLAREVGNEVGRARTFANEALVADRQRSAVVEQLAKLDAQIAASTVRRRAELVDARRELVYQRDTMTELVDKAVQESQALQAVANAQRAAADAAKRRNEQATDAALAIAEIEARAGAVLDQREGLQLRLIASSKRQGEIARRVAEVQADASAGLVDEVTARRALATLRVEDLRLAAADAALARQSQQDRKAAATTARAARDAELSARVKLADVDARIAEGRGDDGAVELRLRALALQADAERSAVARSTNTAAGRAAALLAIERDFADKRAQVAKRVVDDQRAVDDDLVALLETMQAQRVELARNADAAVAQSAATRASILAERARESGDFERAAAIERTQANVDLQAQLASIARDTEAAKLRAVAGTDEALSVERAALARQGEAWEVYAARVARAERQRSEASAEAARSNVERVTSTIGSVSGLGDKATAAIASASEGAKAVAANWGDLAKSAPDAIVAAGGVAAAFVDGEKSKARIMALTEGAAAFASVAVQDYAGAAAHGAAAALYGYAAGSSAPAASGTAATSSTSTSTQGSSASSSSSLASSGGKGNTYVTNFNGILSTRQQVAKGIEAQRRTLRGTGFAA